MHAGDVPCSQPAYEHTDTQNRESMRLVVAFKGARPCGANGYNTNKGLGLVGPVFV